MYLYNRKWNLNVFTVVFAAVSLYSLMVTLLSLTVTLQSLSVTLYSLTVTL